MALNDLLSRMERRTAETPETSCNPIGVSAKPAQIGACTPETPETSQICNCREEWPDSDIEAENDPIDAPQVEPDARISELDRLIDLVAAHHGFTKADIDEAREHAHADIEDALTCFRALVREINGATR